MCILNPECMSGFCYDFYCFGVNHAHPAVICSAALIEIRKKKATDKEGISYGYRNPVLADGLSCVSGLTHRPFKHVT